MHYSNGSPTPGGSEGGVMTVPYCVCGHTQTAHAHGRAVCAIYCCTCQVFRPVVTTSVKVL